MWPLTCLVCGTSDRKSIAPVDSQDFGEQMIYTNSGTFHGRHSVILNSSDKPFGSQAAMRAWRELLTAGAFVVNTDQHDSAISAGKTRRGFTDFFCELPLISTPAFYFKFLRLDGIGRLVAELGKKVLIQLFVIECLSPSGAIQRD
jgi:hypothetical protein